VLLDQASLQRSVAETSQKTYGVTVKQEAQQEHTELVFKKRHGKEHFRALVNCPWMTQGDNGG